MTNVITDLQNSEKSFTIYPSAARTVTPNTQEFEGLGDAAGLTIVTDATAVTGTAPTLTVKVEGVDRLSGKTWTLLQSAAVTAAGTNVLRIHPALTETANTRAAEPLPPVVRVTYTIGGTTPSFTFTSAGHLTYTG